MDRPSITVVIVLCWPDADRLGHARVILERFIAAGVTDILLIEQRAGGAAPDPRIAGLAAGRPAVRHQVLRGSARHFERARLVNRAVQMTSAQYLWLHVPDLLLPVTSILKEFQANPALAVKPFAGYQKLTAEESRRVTAGESMEAAGTPGKKTKGASFGNASLIVDRSVFLLLGGLNERFRGEGDECIEFMRRFRLHFRDMHVYGEFAGAMLHRVVSSREKAATRASRSLKDRLIARMEGNPERYYRRSLRSSLAVSLREIEAQGMRLARERTLRVSAYTPPPVIEERLPGELWGITTYFNPMGYHIKKGNYDLFRKGLAAIGLPLLTVELAFDDAPFELGPGDAEELVQLRATDVLWQKERLLNVGLARLPSRCDKVVWLDCDVLFDNDRWADETARLLERHVVVQPFTLSVRLRFGERAVALDDLPIGNSEHELLHGMAYGHLAKGPRSMSSFLSHGHSGYAWAIRRSVIERHGFYDANILGNADLNMAHAMFGGSAYLKTDRLSTAAREHLVAWARGFYEDVRGSVAPVEGTLFHLWHGDKKHRLYEKRLSVLIDNGYDPRRDIAIASNGTYRWASSKPALHAWCRRYFRERREERGWRERLRGLVRS